MAELVIVAHGSRRDDSNQEVMALAARVRALPGLTFSQVSIGFLELAEPPIPAALKACAARGATEIVVFPYFLAAGRHVAEDIPGQVAPFIAAHPKIKVQIAPHLGAAEQLAQLINRMCAAESG